MTKHIELLINTTNITAIKLNPQAFKIKPANKNNPVESTASFAVNINYSEKGIPIGIYKVNNRIYNSLDSYKLKYRPAIVFKKNICSIITGDDFKKYDTACQAGCLVVPKMDLNAEYMTYSMIRANTNQVYLGVTAHGKLIGMHTKKITIHESKEILKEYGCISAMKCDGGSASFFFALIDDKIYNYGQLKMPIAGLQFIL